MIPIFIKNLFLNYERIVKGRLPGEFTNIQNDVDHWKNQLFIKFLVYCFPVSLIALLPGIYMAFKVEDIIIVIIDSSCFLLLSVATFSIFLSLKYRKLLIITTFYILAIVLISNLGYIGPGIFYLFAITILIALILPIRYAYGSIAVNTIILLSFAWIIYSKSFNVSLLQQYSVGSWLAFSSNLIFLSIVLVILIHSIFDRLHEIIITKDQLQVKYKNIFENSPSPLFLYDTQSLKFLNANEAAIKHYGYSNEDFMAMTIKDIRPPENVHRFLNIIESNKEAVRSHHKNVIHVKKNGEKINVSVESSLLEFNGHPARLVLITDVTSQLKIEQEIQKSALKLKQSELNLRTIFESTIDGFVLLNSSNCIIVFNSKATESMLFNNSKIAFEPGRSIFDYVADTKRAYFNELLQRVRLGEVIDYKRKFKRKGKTHWVHYTLTPVREGGLITGTCITGRDITEHKQYVQTIEEQNKIFQEISWIQSHLVRAPLARLMALTSLLATETDENEKAEMLRLLQLSSNELDEVIKKITGKTTNII